MHDTTTSDLTTDEVEVFSILGAAMMFDPAKVSLVRSTLNGENVAVVVYINDDGVSENVEMRPLAVLVDDTLFNALADPVSLLTSGGTEGVQAAG